jgi:hypothetical protein
MAPRALADTLRRTLRVGGLREAKPSEVSQPGANRVCV